jgi:hypothetical protein
MRLLFQLRPVFEPGIALSQWMAKGQVLPKVLLLIFAITLLILLGVPLLILVIILLYLLICAYLAYLIEQAPRLHRIIVKLDDSIPVPPAWTQSRRAKKQLSAVGVQWSSLRRQFPELISIEPLFTSVTPQRINQLTERAVNLDPTYSPVIFSNYLTFLMEESGDYNALIQVLARRRTNGLGRAYRAPLPENANQPAPAQVVQQTLEPKAIWQRYLFPAPEGLGVLTPGFPSIAGAGSKFVDVEYNWDLFHADLRDLQGQDRVKKIHGKQNLSTADKMHGTNVLGILMATVNAADCMGIAYDVSSANVSAIMESDGSSNLDNAILAAINELSFGEVLVLPLQWARPDGTKWPVESETTTFNLIRLATALGITVVEAAGNGAQDLDRVAPFLTNDDSGAIMVGASDPNAIATFNVDHYEVAPNPAAVHAPYYLSNFGARVNCFAWGANVLSLAAGLFDRTSAASAIVGGAAIVVQSIQKAAGGPAAPKDLRDAITYHGTASTPSNGGIGVMPDLPCVLVWLSNLPDLYIRDSITDVGTPHVEQQFDSPDIIVSSSSQAPATFSNAQANNLSEPLSVSLYLYVRLLNRGKSAAAATVHLYSAPPSTVPRPSSWTSVGSVSFPNAIPTGDVLVVSPALPLPSFAGDRAFIALVETPNTPVLIPGDFAAIENFPRLVGNRNLVGIRNLHILRNTHVALPGRPDNQSYVRLDFSMPAPSYKLPDMTPAEVETYLRFDTDVPNGSVLLLEGSEAEVSAMGPQVAVDKETSTAWISVNCNQGTCTLNRVTLPLGSILSLRLLVQIPQAQRNAPFEVAIQQYKHTTLMGRLTWRLIP